MEIIGLSGFARSGKDEAANILVNEFGFKQVAFADKLREVLYALNPLVDIEIEDYEVNINIDERIIHSGHTEQNIYVQDVIDEYGWGGYKETRFGPEIRRLLQRLGTEAGRQTLWDSIWIDASLTGHPEDAKIVVSDARFFNEFDAIRARGGYVWRIDREGVGPVNNHASELEAVDYDKFSLYLKNNGTLEEYQDMIRSEYISGRYKEWNYA